MPENGIILHTSDAKKLGVKSGDQVRVVSATNPEGVWDLGNGTTKAMIGKVQVTETIRPGVVTITLGHGHWDSGAVDVTIDGKLVKVGGSVSFYDTKVKLIKI